MVITIKHKVDYSYLYYSFISLTHVLNLSVTTFLSFIVSTSESESGSVVSDSLQLFPTLCDSLYSPWNSLGQNTGVGSLSFLQGIFPTQGSNPGLPHCRRILYQLSHKGSPRILWVFLTHRNIPDPGIKPGSPALQADSLPAELLRLPWWLSW